MVFWSVTAQTFRSHFELLRAISKCHKTKDPEKNSNRFSTDIFDGSDIDCLSWRGKEVNMSPEEFPLFIDRNSQ